MLRVNASPYVRAILTVDEWTTLNSLNLDGFLLLLADSKRGPFTVKLAANGIRVRGEGNTVGEALASVVAQVAS
jgi:hypothetical protein